MRIDLPALKQSQAERQDAFRSRHQPADRIKPSLFQYDHLVLHSLAADVETLLAEPCSRPDVKARTALDVGSDRSPYREALAQRAWTVQTLDIEAGPGVDYVGTAERTGLADNSFDLVLCTQVIEHCLDPWSAMRELYRVVRPGGYLLWTVPHIWFYHPHPMDNWRFTPEGVARLSEAARFEVVQLLGQGGPAATLFQIFNFCVFGVLGRYGAPIYLVSNAFGRIVDPLAPNPLLCLNFACLCRKPL
jgi:SAM-dependent methyltransferase